MYTCIKKVLCPTVVFSVKVAASQSFLTLKRYNIKKIEIDCAIDFYFTLFFSSFFWIEKVILNAAGPESKNSLRH